MTTTGRHRVFIVWVCCTSILWAAAPAPGQDSPAAQELAAAQRELAELRAELARQKALTAMARAQGQATEERVRKMEAQMAASEAINAKLLAQINAQREEIARRDPEILKLRKELDDCRAEAARLQVQLRAAADGAPPPDLRGQLDKLAGPSADRQAASAALENADPKIALPLVMDRLRRNVETGRGSRGTMERQTVNRPGVQWKDLRLPGENAVLAGLLVKHRATQAVGLIQSALDLAMKEDDAHRDQATTHALAAAVYTLSGRTPECWDPAGRRATTFRPLPYQEEAMREIVQPYLVPTHGLTASLSILGRGNVGQFIVASEPLTLCLELTNRSRVAVDLDLTPGSFTFEYPLVNQYVSVPGHLMPSPRFTLKGQDVTAPAALQPGETLTVTWRGTAGDLPLTKGWGTAYYQVRVRYYPFTDPALMARWADSPLLSNTVIRTYRPGE